MNNNKIALHWSRVNNNLMNDIPTFIGTYEELINIFNPITEIELSDRVYVVSYDLSNEVVHQMHQEVFISANPFTIKKYIDNIKVIIGNVILSDLFIFEYPTYEDAYEYALDVKSAMCNIAYKD